MSTPEAWTTRAYTAFVLVAGALLAAWAMAIEGTSPVAIAINVVVAYLVVVRPVLRVADRRAALDRS